VAPPIPTDFPEGQAQTNPRLVQLERQVERGNLFAHSVLGENRLRLGEVELFLHALIDTLLGKGVVTESEMTATIEKVRSELTERGELNKGLVMIRPENPEEPPADVRVDCQARMHVCHAVCCRLHFALSIREVESGKIKWDLGQPYVIRHESNGCCSHLEAQSGRCDVYQNRPGVCRGYSCAGDSRVWKNFQEMELNQEWIDSNLPPALEPRAVRVLMQPEQRPAPFSRNGDFLNEAGGKG
jgi:Fe-S-cluster containining protein